MTQRHTGAALAAAAVLVLGACGAGDEPSSATTAEDTEPTSAAPATAPVSTTGAPLTEPPATTTVTTEPAPTEPSVSTAPAGEPGSTAPAVAGDLWEDPSGTFRIAFPVDPSVQNVQAPLPDGTSLPVTAYLAEVAGAAAIASCVVYPADSAPDPDTVLESARDGALANVGAELVTSTPVDLQGRPGVSYRGAIGEAGGVLARTYLDGLQLCQVLVVGEPATIEETAPAILNSFEFVKEAA